MPLNLQVNDGGEFVPYIKYNSKAGRWYVKSPEGADIEVVNPRLAFDMANIKTGWVMFSEGMGPVWAWDISSSEMAPKPDGKYKRGFYVLTVGGDSLPGIGALGLREFTSNANVVIAAMLSMYRKYEEGAAANPGKVPFFQCSGVKPISGMHGTNYEPLFELIGWVERAKVPQFDEHLAAQPQREIHPPPPVGGGVTGPATTAPFAPPDMPAHAAPPPPPPGPPRDLDDEIPF